MNRFDLEEAIMRVWGTTEEIELILRNSESFLDLCENLDSVRVLHDLKAKELFDIFEDLVRTGVIE